MFQVIWRQEAVNDLAEIWNHGDSALRRAITQAAQSIDQALQEDPSIPANQGRRESE
jgi:plasmid stabilization system protein ParE